MSFIIVKLELPFTLKPEEIAADLRQLLAVEQFSDLPVVTGERPEVGGTLQWGQRRDTASVCIVVMVCSNSTPIFDVGSDITYLQTD